MDFECCQNWMEKGQERKRCFRFYSPSLQRGHHPSPTNDHFWSLSQVGILFASVHHMKILAFKGHFSFQIPGCHHFGSSGKWFEKIWRYLVFGVYWPCFACSQINSSELFVSWICEEWRVEMYMFQISTQLSRISRAWFSNQPWCQMFVVAGSATWLRWKRPFFSFLLKI